MPEISNLKTIVTEIALDGYSCGQMCLDNYKHKQCVVAEADSHRCTLFSIPNDTLAVFKETSLIEKLYAEMTGFVRRSDYVGTVICWKGERFNTSNVSLNSLFFVIFYIYFILFSSIFYMFSIFFTGLKFHHILLKVC